MILNKNDKIAIVACSNGQSIENKEIINDLLKTIGAIGLVPVCSDYIFEKYSVFSGTGEERAKALMEFYEDKNIKAIFDISGGDLANEVLEYLDFNIIKNNPKPFFGYSDLTTIINAIFTKTQNVSYLYQVRNLIYEYSNDQIDRFKKSLIDGKKDLFNIKYKFLCGETIEGTVIGGNIRCFLKLAGTEYMPCFDDKILLLESHGGEVALMSTYLAQLKQIGALKKVNGIILGTFTKMENNKINPTIEELVMKFTNGKIPVVKTYEIGHGSDSKAIKIGEYIKLKK